MNNENVDFLQNQVKYAGFGEGLAGALVKEIKAGNEEFKLQHSHTFGKDNVDATLHFKKSKESDMYFFNSYDVTMKKEGGKDVSNTFYINQGQSITLKEAYNLLNGRAVEKELQRKLSPAEKEQFKAEAKLPREQRGLPENWEKAPTYKAWVQLDMKHRDENGNFIQKQFHERYGFNLEASLEKLPLRKMDASAKEDVLSSLQKGNVQQVQFTIDGKDQKMYLAADPQFKAITVYDANMKLAKKETYSQHTKKEQEPAQEQQQAAGQKAERGASSDLVPGPEAPWEEKKSSAKKDAAQDQKEVTKSDLLPKHKKGNGLMEKKNKNTEGKAMKVA